MPDRSTVLSVFIQLQRMWNVDVRQTVKVCILHPHCALLNSSLSTECILNFGQWLQAFLDSNKH